MSTDLRAAEPLPDTRDWALELIERYHEVIRQTAERFGLETYPNQLEIITAEQMMDAYASVGMPINYRHWSYGKDFIATDKRYRRGQMGLAYEIVINSNPCISYLMEENTTAMQALVVAHAAYGHNSFFKGNYLFRMWTDASSIIDYLVFARRFVSDCEERYGMETVEAFLDSCHALASYGVDRYRRPSKKSLVQELSARKDREAFAQTQVNDLWRTLPRKEERRDDSPETQRFPREPQENLLYFIEKNAPLLEPWQREIVRLVRKIAQYFYPQRQTQVMNEGWATFWHHRLLNQEVDRLRASQQVGAMLGAFLAEQALPNRTKELWAEKRRLWHAADNRLTNRTRWLATTSRYLWNRLKTKFMARRHARALRAQPGVFTHLGS